MINNENFFITSDTFFGRDNIIKIANRPFQDVEQMNLDMITKWNSKISKKDKVVHLGNFAWDPVSALDALTKLNYKTLIILPSSKDDAIHEVKEQFKNVTVIDKQIYEEVWKDKKFIFSHYPLEEWNEKENGSIHFHGYSLKKIKNNFKKQLRVNVCCDVWNLAPIDIELILDFIKEVDADI